MNSEKGVGSRGAGFPRMALIMTIVCLAASITQVRPAAGQANPDKIKVVGYLLDSTYSEDPQKMKQLRRNLREIYCKQKNVEGLLPVLFSSEINASKTVQPLPIGDSAAKLLYIYANSDKDSPENKVKVILVIAFPDEVAGTLQFHRVSKQTNVKPWSFTKEMKGQRCDISGQRPESFVPGFGTTWTILANDEEWKFQVER
ncbi:MAG: hypothetical protein AAGU21_14965 [Solidesulfovibrio sp.]|uniref:hypothetical protein n=1 Tax=Solidesulfovibrio sp. TaxID=2910990 RepID=UPI0031598F65